MIDNVKRPNKTDSDFLEPFVKTSIVFDGGGSISFRFSGSTAGAEEAGDRDDGDGGDNANVEDGFNLIFRVLCNMI